MENNQELSTINESKEIADIIKEYRKTELLLKEKRYDELEQHIESVKYNHVADVVIHNAVNPIPPMSLEQNAYNCMAFLRNLAIAKGAKNVFNEQKNI